MAGDVDGTKEALATIPDHFSKRYFKPQENLSIDDFSLFSFYEWILRYEEAYILRFFLKGSISN